MKLRAKIHHYRFRNGRFVITCDPYNNRETAYAIDTRDNLFSCKRCKRLIEKNKGLNWEAQLRLFITDDGRRK